jgi:hypothetical protein
MLEFLIMLPNLAAGYLTMQNNAFFANCVYCFGYVPFIYRNIKRKDFVQAPYFLILWVMSVVGVIKFVS